MELMECDDVLKLSVLADKESQGVVELAYELIELSDRIIILHYVLDRTPSFSVNRPGEDTGIEFAGVPLGHEFTSLVLALLQVSGRPPKMDENLVKQIQALEGEYHFETYVSLTCQVCPDVVQTLNA